MRQQEPTPQPASEEVPTAAGTHAPPVQEQSWRSQYMNKQFLRLALVWIAIGVCVACVMPIWAHDYKQLRVVINQLDSATVPDRQKREKEMNDILKQCQKHGIYLQVTIENVRTNQNPTNSSGTNIAPGGNVPNDQAADALDKLGMKGEVKTSGVKVWVGKEVRYGTNNVAASNQVVNGTTVRGRPSTVIGQQSGVNGDARTWTHELGHCLGLDHVSTNATNNLMHPARSSGGKANGSELTKEQCEKLQKGADKRSPKTGKTKEQTNQPPAKTVSRIMVDETETGPLYGTPRDLDWAQLVVDYNLLDPVTNALHVDTFVNAALDPPPLTNRYLVWLDLDNDLATGDSNGFDVVAIQQLLTSTNGQALLMWLPGGPTVPLPAISADSISREATGETNGFETAIGSVVSCMVPLDMFLPMGMAPEIRVFVTSADELLNEEDAIGPEQMTTVPPPEPSLILNVIETLPGNAVVVQGADFTPSTPYRITFDSTIVDEGITTPLGEIDTSFVAPDLVPGDYLVDAIDADCQVQIAVLRLLDNQGLSVAVEGSEVRLNFRTHPGPTYVVEYKEDLLDPGPWIELLSTNTVESQVTIVDPGPLDQARFYRWRQE